MLADVLQILRFGLQVQIADDVIQRGVLELLIHKRFLRRALYQVLDEEYIEFGLVKFSRLLQISNNCLHDLLLQHSKNFLVNQLEDVLLDGLVQNWSYLLMICADEFGGLGELLSDDDFVEAAGHANEFQKQCHVLLS